MLALPPLFIIKKIISARDCHPFTRYRAYPSLAKFPSHVITQRPFSLIPKHLLSPFADSLWFLSQLLISSKFHIFLINIQEWWMVVNYFVIYFVLTFILVGFGWSCVATAGGGCPFWCCPPARRVWPEIRYRSRRSAPAGRHWTEKWVVFDALLRPSILSPEESSPR